MSKKSKTKGKRPLQVLFLPTDDGGCGWYRIRQFNDAFQLRDDVTSYLMDGKEPTAVRRRHCWMRQESYRLTSWWRASSRRGIQVHRMCRRKGLSSSYMATSNIRLSRLRGAKMQGVCCGLLMRRRGRYFTTLARRSSWTTSQRYRTSTRSSICDRLPMTLQYGQYSHLHRTRHIGAIDLPRATR